MKAIFEFDVPNSCAECALCYKYKLSFSPIEGYERSCGSHICVVTHELLDNAGDPPPPSCPLKIVPSYAAPLNQGTIIDASICEFPKNEGRLTLTQEQRKNLGVGYVTYMQPELLKEWDKKLTAYEDAAPLEKVQEWAKAVNEGRLVVLPCKLGDTVYWISPFNTCIYQGIIFAIKTSKFGIDLEISQSEKNHLTVKRELEKCFLTREEAEAALKKLKE